MTDADHSGRPLLILGASARAAAESARRAGFAPTSLDLFGDRDLPGRVVAGPIPVGDYPARLFDLAADLTDSPWIYTGAIENHPDRVDALAARRTLLGIGGAALRAVRDPARWSLPLRAAGIPTLATLGPDDRPPTAGRWLLKPNASGGGRGIRRWTIGSGPIPPGLHLQAEVGGAPLGVSYLGDGRSARLLGATRQVLGRSSEGLAVVYRGSVGPLRFGPTTGRGLRRVGDALASAFGLKGLFGVDFVLEGATAWPVEINPRYTASMEVLERARGVSLVAELAASFGLDPGPTEISESAWAVAKLILRASRRLLVPGEIPWFETDRGWAMVADIPAAGQVIEEGQPVLTIFAQGRSIGPAMASLRARARAWRGRLDGWALS